MTQKFSKKEALKFGWEKGWGIFLPALLIVSLIFLGLNLLIEKTGENLRDLNIFILFIILNLLYFIFSVIISISFIRVSLKICDNEKPKLKDVFCVCDIKLFFKYLFCSILYSLIVLLGTIFFIVPGIILGIKFGFANYLIVDKNLGPIQALKKSSLITKGSKWDLFLFYLLTFLINFLGLLCFIVGIFVSIPVTWIATAFVYRKLLAQAENLDIQPAPENDIQLVENKENQLLEQKND